jgi:hypothetical protein
MDSITIILAGTEYKVRKLTLRQARALGIGVVKELDKTPDGLFAGSVDQAIAVVACALERDYPTVTPSALLDMEMGVRELRKASDDILIFAGYLTAPPVAADGEKPAGEAQAAPEAA